MPNQPQDLANNFQRAYDALFNLIKWVHGQVVSNAAVAKAYTDQVIVDVKAFVADNYFNKTQSDARFVKKTDSINAATLNGKTEGDIFTQAGQQANAYTNAAIGRITERFDNDVTTTVTTDVSSLDDLIRQAYGLPTDLTAEGYTQNAIDGLNAGHYALRFKVPGGASFALKMADDSDPTLLKGYTVNNGDYFTFKVVESKTAPGGKAFGTVVFWDFDTQNLIASVSGRVDNNEMTLGAHTTQFEVLDSTIADINAAKVVQDDAIALLGTQVASKVSQTDFDQSQSSRNTQIGQLHGRIGSAESDISTLGTDINAKVSSTDFQASQDVQDVKLANINTKLTKNDGDIIKILADINTLQTAQPDLSAYTTTADLTTSLNEKVDKSTYNADLGALSLKMSEVAASVEALAAQLQNNPNWA